MRIVVIGHTGTIGTLVVKALESRGHEVIGVSRSSNPGLNTTDFDSIRSFFNNLTERVDAVVSAAGGAPFKPLAELTAEDFLTALSDKAAGQIAIAQSAVASLKDGGSITLVSGILSKHPVPTGAAASVANAAVEAYARAAAGALPRGIRINVVSPTVLEEALEAYGPAFPGFKAVPGVDVANTFVRSIEGIETGQVFEVWTI